MHALDQRNSLVGCIAQLKTVNQVHLLGGFQVDSGCEAQSPNVDDQDRKDLETWPHLLPSTRARTSPGAQTWAHRGARHFHARTHTHTRDAHAEPPQQTRARAVRLIQPTSPLKTTSSLEAAPPACPPPPSKTLGRTQGVFSCGDIIPESHYGVRQSAVPATTQSSTR